MFRRNRRFKNVRPSEAQIAWCQKLGVHVTGEMSVDDVGNLIDQTQARLIKTLLQAAGIREGSIVEYPYSNHGLQLCVVTRFSQKLTWVRFLGEKNKRYSLATLSSDDGPLALSYRPVYTGPLEWTHSLSVLPMHASDMRADLLLKRTDALHRYIGTHLVSDHRLMHETYGEYWSTAEVARLKTLFEEEFPDA
jgi:hypothetical protein